MSIRVKKRKGNIEEDGNVFFWGLGSKRFVEVVIFCGGMRIGRMERI